jgi:uncharacterized protein
MPKTRIDQAKAVLAFVQQRGVVHPREVDAHFAHGSARGGFGGTSNASTQLLDAMHYMGMLRIEKRINGIRTCAVASLTSESIPAEQALNSDMQALCWMV